MKKVSLAILALIFMFSCNNENIEGVVTPPTRNGHGVSIKSVYRPDLGRYVAPNFDPSKRHIIKSIEELPDPEELLAEYYANSRTTARTPSGGKITYTWTHYKPSQFTPERWPYISSGGYIVSGVGAMILTSSNNYWRMCVEYRFLYPNGTMGDPFLVWDLGDNCDDEYSCLEAFLEVPDGNVVVGVGARGKYDVYNLTVWYKPYNASTNRITGSGYGTPIHGGLQADGDNDIWIRVHDYIGSGWYDDRDLIQNVGLTANSCGTCNMAADIGRLQ